jgi:hypothetical protein
MIEVFALSTARNGSARNFKENVRSKDYESRNFKENVRSKGYE